MSDDIRHNFCNAEPAASRPRKDELTIQKNNLARIRKMSPSLRWLFCQVGQPFSFSAVNFLSVWVHSATVMDKILETAVFWPDGGLPVGGKKRELGVKIPYFWGFQKLSLNWSDRVWLKSCERKMWVPHLAFLSGKKKKKRLFFEQAKKMALKWGKPIT